MIYHHECCCNLGVPSPVVVIWGGSPPQRRRNLRGVMWLTPVYPPHEKARRRRNLGGVTPPRHAGRTSLWQMVTTLRGVIAFQCSVLELSIMDASKEIDFYN